MKKKKGREFTYVKEKENVSLIIFIGLPSQLNDINSHKVWLIGIMWALDKRGVNFFKE